MPKSAGISSGYTMACLIQRVVETEAKRLGEPVAKAAKRVVWHEIGHYFGFGEKKIRELEKKWEKDKRLE